MGSVSEEPRDIELECMESPPEIDLVTIVETQSPSSPRRVSFVEDAEQQLHTDVGDGESVPSSPAKSSPDPQFETLSSLSSLTTGRSSYATTFLRSLMFHSPRGSRWQRRRTRSTKSSPQNSPQRRKKPQISPMKHHNKRDEETGTPRSSRTAGTDDDTSSVWTNLWRRATLRSPMKRKESPHQREEKATSKKRKRIGYHHDDDEMYLRSPRRKHRRRRGGASRVSENYGTVHRPPCLARCCIFLGTALVVMVIGALFYNPTQRRVPSSDDDAVSRIISATNDSAFDATESPTPWSTATLYPTSATSTERRVTVVEKYGNLVVNGTQMYSSNTGSAVQLRGVSLSDKDGSFYSREVVEILAEKWNCSVVRAVVGVEGAGGYLQQPEVQRERVLRVVDAALEVGIYVVVDWHTSHAEDYLTDAVFFFADIVSRYGNTPNVLFEIYGRPVMSDWKTELKPYATTIANVIRRTGCPNLLIIGTSTWNQDVDEAALDPIDGVENVAYALHFSARTHQHWLRDKASAALDAGAALFVSQWSSTFATGDGDPDPVASRDWMDFLDASKISHINWHVGSGEDDHTSALLQGTDATNPAGWSLDNFSPSGLIVLGVLTSRHYFS